MFSRVPVWNRICPVSASKTDRTDVHLVKEGGTYAKYVVTMM